MRNYYPMFDLESYCIVRDLHRDSKVGTVEVSIRPYIQRYALNTTLTLCYGIRMDEVYDTLLREILYVGSAISLLRSASENYQDYIPILRYLPNNEKTARSKELRARRDAYLDLLLNKVREMIKKGTDKPCISAAILKDEETRLTGVEVGSICLSLVSGGFETIPGTLVSCIGSLSTPAGQVFQERAYEDIKKCYPDLKEAWATEFEKEDVPYLNAIVKEAGRYYTVSSMSLPRKTVTDVRWNGVVIPAKTMVLINAQAGNHGKDNTFSYTTYLFDLNADILNQMSTTSVPTPELSTPNAGSLLPSPLRNHPKASHTFPSALALALVLVLSSPQSSFTLHSFVYYRYTRSKHRKVSRRIRIMWITMQLRVRW